MDCRTAGISQTVMIAGDDGGHARDRHGLVDDWGLPTAGLDWDECRAPDQCIVASDAAGVAVVVAARIVMLVVVSSGHSRMLPVSVQPGNVHVASWRSHPSYTAVSGRGSYAVWHGCASKVKHRPLNPLVHDSADAQPLQGHLRSLSDQDVVMQYQR